VTAARRVTIPYKPRPQQLEIHAALDAHRFAVINCHRRFGKSVGIINHIIKGAVTCKRLRPRFAYIAPLYRQAKSIAWDYLLHYTAPIPGRDVHESELRVDFPNGARIQLFGADNPDALRGMYLDGVALDEFGQMPGKAWSEVIRPALSDRNGWAVVSGTPQGKNQFYDLYQQASTDPAWFVRTYKASETGIIPEAELRALRRDMTEEEYQQEYECSWSAAIRGAYYAKLLDEARDQRRIRPLPIARDLRAETWWDIGSANTAIWWVQPTSGMVHVVDYWESAETSIGLPELAQLIHGWAERHKVTYSAHRAPFDIGDVDFSTGVTRIETAARLGVKFVSTPKVDVRDGIEAVKNLIPRCLFDEERTAQGREGLYHYRAEADRNGHLKPKPVHDWSSHPADAFRTGAVGMGRRFKKGPDYAPRRSGGGARGPSWATM
jgi:hypothetical protein